MIVYMQIFDGLNSILSLFLVHEDMGRILLIVTPRFINGIAGR